MITTMKNRAAIGPRPPTTKSENEVRMHTGTQCIVCSTEILLVLRDGRLFHYCPRCNDERIVI